MSRAKAAAKRSPHPHPHSPRIRTLTLPASAPSLSPHPQPHSPLIRSALLLPASAPAPALLPALCDLPLPRLLPLYVSGGGPDNAAERSALQQDVFPYLRLLCATRGLGFEAIDLRRGLPSAEALLCEPGPMKAARAELARCRTARLGPRCPSLLLLLGDRYGPRPLPSALPASELDRLGARLPREGPSRKALDRAYEFDANRTLPAAFATPAESLASASATIGGGKGGSRAWRDGAVVLPSAAASAAQGPGGVGAGKAGGGGAAGPQPPPSVSLQAGADTHAQLSAGAKRASSSSSRSHSGAAHAEKGCYVLRERPPVIPAEAWQVRGGWRVGRDGGLVKRGEGGGRAWCGVVRKHQDSGAWIEAYK